VSAVFSHGFYPSDMVNKRLPLNRDNPAHGIRCFAILDVGDGFVQTIGHGTNFSIRDGNDGIAIFQFADGRNDGCRAGAKYFLKLSGSTGFHDFIDADTAFGGFDSP